MINTRRYTQKNQESIATAIIKYRDRENMATDYLKLIINKLYKIMLIEIERPLTHVEIDKNKKHTQELLAHVENYPKDAHRAYVLYSQAIDKARHVKEYLEQADKNYPKPPSFGV